MRPRGTWVRGPVVAEEAHDALSQGGRVERHRTRSVAGAGRTADTGGGTHATGDEVADTVPHGGGGPRARRRQGATPEQLQGKLEAAKNEIVVLKTRSTSLQQAVHYDVLQEALLHKTAQLTDLEGRSQRQLVELWTDHQLTQQQLAQCERDHEEQREELDRVRTDLLEQQISQELQQTELNWLAGQHVDLEASTELLRTASSAVSAGETHDESADDMVVLEQECVVSELEPVPLYTICSCSHFLF